MGEVEFPWVGGRPSLDLCNTSVEGCDLLDDGSALAAWLSKAGCARTCGLPEPDDLGRIRRLRDDLRAGFLAHDADAISAILDSWFLEIPGHLAVDPETREPVFRTDPTTFGCLVTPILLDALAITRDHLDRVRLCAAERCSMIYLDASRNGSRRWCSMDRCGSRAKAHAYYERKRHERSPSRR